LIAHRTRVSLTQLLAQQQPAIVITLLSKYGARVSINYGSAVYDLLNAVRSLNDHQVMHVLAEVVATAEDLRFRITLKYRFDVRMHDLTQCLALDGYQIEDKQLRQTDPSITDALRTSGEISLEEERGLAGVFQLLSPGAHRPVGIPQGQMTRLGRSFALNMC